jgi:CRP-like cAMP-binding protein
MPRREIPALSLLAALPMFKALGEATLSRLAAVTTKRRLGPGENVFRRGDVPTGLYVVVHGEIRLVARTPGRGERLTGVVGAGRSFGEPVMFLDRPAVVDAEAVGDALVLHVPKEAVFAEIDRNPRFARRVIANLSQRVEALVRDVDRLSGGTGRERLVDYLVRTIGEVTGPATVALPATKVAIAAKLNLTPEHFSRLLHELAAEGLLEIRGRRIAVPDVGRLSATSRVRGRRSRAADDEPA